MAHGTPDEPGTSPWDIPGGTPGGAGYGGPGGAGGHLPVFGQPGGGAPQGPGTAADGAGVPPFVGAQGSGFGPTADAAHAAPYGAPVAGFGTADPSPYGAPASPPPFAPSQNSGFHGYGYGSAPADQDTQVIHTGAGGPRFVLPPESGATPANPRRRKTILLSALAATAVVGVTAGVVAAASGSSSPARPALAGHPAGTTATSGAPAGTPAPAAPGASSGRGGAPVAGATPSATVSGAKATPGKAGSAPSGGATSSGAVSQNPAALDSSLVLHWRLGDRTGSATVADSSGRGLAGTIAGAVALGAARGGEATFTGTPGQIKGGTISAAGPVADTTKSFTVSAWVNQAAPTTPTKYVTLLSQDGKAVSGFWLTYSQASGLWTFGRAQSDSAAPATDEAWAKTTVPLNTWVLLTGVYNADAKTVSLYINGTLQTTTPMHTAPYASTGAFVLGRSWYNTYPSNPFNGMVSDVRVYDRVLTAAEVQSLLHA